MDRLEFIPAFEAAIRSADPEKLAALRAIVRQQGGPDEFAKTSTELVRKHPLTLFRSIKIICDAAHQEPRS
ncbi:hypothetical protein HAP48_0000680 (plasmid) [Bradyrhizobium septentrionale]|uniref:Uncharacterized protein n=1 Tax=Bradyrhizobium septentrionale TaxID=1404411 RepID=A0A973WB71_9BRAD|nr:hypothetical protein [Bradyrhizobium septentrionale]UGY11986.1 hypothetical protein HAP48_0000680 [Bradyrhizobium septentrionale]